MSTTQREQRKENSGRGLKVVVLLTTLVALVLAGALAAIMLLPNNRTDGPQEQTSLFESTLATQTSVPAIYTITLDVSAYPGAVLANNTVVTRICALVDHLPFATLDGMRFTGWYTGPPDDASATLIDNNSLDQIQPDTDQTLYARFEPRPTSIDYDDPGLPILMYHYFYDPDLGETGADANWMNIHLFEGHLAWLQSNHYYYPSWDEVVAYIRGEIVLPEHSIVLTSDDGNESFFRLAIPLVIKYNAKMTSFLVLHDLQPSMFPDVDQHYIYFGSHSYDMHRGGSDGDARILTSTYQEIYDDAIAGGQIIGNMLVYCLPYGKSNDIASQALSDAGVGVALAIENERAYPLCDPMFVPRLRMSDGCGVDYLASIAS